LLYKGESKAHLFSPFIDDFHHKVHFQVFSLNTMRTDILLGNIVFRNKDLTSLEKNIAFSIELLTKKVNL